MIKKHTKSMWERVSAELTGAKLSRKHDWGRQKQKLAEIMNLLNRYSCDTAMSVRMRYNQNIVDRFCKMLAISPAPRLRNKTSGPVW